MKVVHVTLRFDAPGGVETTVRELTRRLKAVGDEVEVYASDLVDESRWIRGREFRTEVDGVPVRRFGVLRRPFPSPRSPLLRRAAEGISLPILVGLVDALRESRADVIHAHSHRYGLVLQAAAVARACHIPLVVSTHYHPADRRESAIKRGLLRCEDVGFGMSAYRVARALVAESEYEARLVREFAPARRVRVIPPGIDLNAWASPTADRAVSVALPGSYLLFVGRIASNKGLDFLFDALASFPPTERPALVVMGPDWGERSRLERRGNELGLAPTVRWLGMVEDPREYRAVIRGARALVLPSEWEAYGLVLLDAMAAGTPVIATAVGGLPEVLAQGTAGRLVPYGDRSALGDAIRSVMTDATVHRKLADAGRARVAEFDWSVAVQRHRALYEELVAGGAARRSPPAM